MTDAIYYYQEPFIEKLFRYLVPILQYIVVCFALAVLLIVQQGDKEIEELEKTITKEDDVSVLIEKIPLEEVSEAKMPELTIAEEDIIQAKKEAEMKEVLVEEETVKEINVEQEEVITVNSKPAYSLSDKELLSQIMYAEEGVFFREYEKDPAKVERVHKLAGSAVLHRLENNHMGANSLADVLYAEGQYAKQTISKVEEGQDIPEIVYVWAEQLINEGALGPKGMIYQAQFAQGEFYEQIGNQIFGVEPKYN